MGYIGIGDIARCGILTDEQLTALTEAYRAMDDGTYPIPVDDPDDEYKNMLKYLLFGTNETTKCPWIDIDTKWGYLSHDIFTAYIKIRERIITEVSNGRYTVNEACFWDIMHQQQNITETLCLVRVRQYKCVVSYLLAIMPGEEGFDAKCTNLVNDYKRLMDADFADLLKKHKKCFGTEDLTYWGKDDDVNTW